MKKMAYAGLVAAAMVALGVPGIQAADLKSGDAVLDNYVEVTGGAPAYSKIHNLILKGTMSMAAMGLKGTMTMYSAEPNKVSMVGELAGVGKIMEGSDGTNAWSFSAMQGPQLKKGEELADSLREAVFQKETQWRTVYKSAELSGVEDVDGKPAYKVVLTPKTGGSETQYYDKATGLLVRHQSIRKTAFGEIPVDVAISDHRKECGGVTMPHNMVQSVAGQKIEIHIDSIACNGELPTDTFLPPPEVKALISKQ